MEKQLFDWEELLEVSIDNMQFGGCILKQNIGSYLSGDEFAAISINFEEGVMALYKHEDDLAPVQRIKLILTPGEVVPIEQTS